MSRFKTWLYTGQPSYAFINKLRTFTKQYDPQKALRAVLRPPPAIKSNYQIKDPISLQLQSDVVYHLQCKNCSDTYIGKTIRQTIRRFKEHGASTDITSSHLPTSPLPPSTITSNNNNIFIQNTALKNKLLDIINDPEIIHFDTNDLGIKINSISPTTKS
ncbi:unnamed protein product [Didymodactylos carnosus]|uniref:Uncharacterized protein n=1 Tax=Didymodactylos carnosus TaxID=1234261 RepID=A0A815FNB7_9BILA|nr:unnamed protein product [Didymodactylos carnosus]CAF4178994.1 unnamed protein product [Didymodactylos carnosus]